MYRDNQFERSSVYSGEKSFEYTNPRFTYPKRAVRIQTGLDGNGFPVGPDALKSVSVPLKAGFMRNLWTGYNTGQDLPRTKLQFQFNPQDIQQEVVARQDMYLSVLQDPTQLSQPVAGNANFSFDLLFDRTMEVKNGGNRKATLNDPPGVGPGDTGPGDAADIGVLADLQILYSIIGQGMNSATMSEQSARIRRIAEAEYQRAVASMDPYFNKNNAWELNSVKGDEPYVKRDFNTLYNNNAGFTAFTSNVNIGNAAFLIPMPVRIIFSSLYMVDGYVVSSSVKFTKFSTNMVPIQCRVLLSVNAVYLGFTRDKTFITEQIAQSVAEERKLKESTKTEVNNFITNYATKYLKSLNVAFSARGELVNRNPTYPGFAVDRYLSPSAVGFGAKGAWWEPPSDDNPAISVGWYNTEEGSSIGSNIKKFFDSGGVIDINLAVEVYVYGPYDTAEAAKAGGGDYIGFYRQVKRANSSDSWSDSLSWVFPLTPENTTNIINSAITIEKAVSKGWITLEQANEFGLPLIAALQSSIGFKYFSFKVKADAEIKDTNVSTTTSTKYSSGAKKTAEQTFVVLGNTMLGTKVVTLNFDWSSGSSQYTTYNFDFSGLTPTP